MTQEKPINPHYAAAEAIVRFMPTNRDSQVRRVAQHVMAAVDVATAVSAEELRTASGDLSAAVEAILPFARLPYAGDPSFDDLITAARDVVRKHRPEASFDD